MCITYPQLRTDLFYEVERSSGLKSWSINGVNSSINNGNVTASISTNNSKDFLRLKVALANEDSSTPGAVTSPFPTLENISLEWPISGDENRNSIVNVRYRKSSDSSWADGLPLKRIPAGSNAGFSWQERHAGSIFDLEPGTLYVVELTLDDPNGGSEIQTLEITTRTKPTLPVNPTIITATPSNLNNILNTLTPGDYVNLSSGNYSGFTIPRDGAADAPIVITGSTGANITGEVYLFSRTYVHLHALNINGRIRFNGSDHITITSCQIQGTEDREGHGIVCFTRGENSYIANNTITGLTEWTEESLGNNGNNIGKGIAVTGPGHVIEHNRVSGFRDGISFLEDSGAVDQFSIDILNNEISECADDGIEADFSLGNCRIMRNRITNTFIAMSSQPSLGGPTYFIRNSAYNVTHVPFKLYRGSQGDVIYHNTVIKNGDAFAMYNGSSAIAKHTCMRNNLFIGGAGGIYNGFSSGTGDSIRTVNIDLSTSDLNYDAFGSTTGFQGRLGNINFSSLNQLRDTTSETFAQEVSLSDFQQSIQYPADPLIQYPT